MVDMSGSTLTAEQAITVELAGLALAGTPAADEIELLQDTAADYFADPAAALRPASDQSLGAGVSLTMLTPYLLAAAQVVLPFLAAFAGDLAKDVVKDLVKDPAVAGVRRFFRGRSPEAPLVLSPAQAERLRQAILAQCHAAQVPSDTAGLVAHATLGSLHIGS